MARAPCWLQWVCARTPGLHGRRRGPPLWAGGQALCLPPPLWSGGLARAPVHSGAARAARCTLPLWDPVSYFLGCGLVKGTNTLTIFPPQKPLSDSSWHGFGFLLAVWSWGRWESRGCVVGATQAGVCVWGSGPLLPLGCARGTCWAGCRLPAARPPRSSGSESRGGPARLSWNGRARPLPSAPAPARPSSLLFSSRVPEAFNQTQSLRTAFSR